MYGTNTRKRKYGSLVGYTSASARPFKKPRRTVRIPTATQQRRRSNIRYGGFLGIEYKFYDQSLVGASLTAPTDASGMEHNPSATICLNTVTQGTGEKQRDGKNICMKSLYIEGIIEVPQQANQTVTDTAGVVFIAIVLDKQTNGALLNSEDVYLNVAGSAKVAATPFRNLEYSKRFRILAKKRIKLPQPITSYDGTNMEQHGYQIPFKFWIKLPNIISTYSDTTETIANITDNSISLLACSTSLGLAPTITYQSRLRFVG